MRCDVPFGTLEVPVVAVTGEGKQELRVEVVDGIGHFRLPSKPSQVHLDPHGMVLARGRKVSLR